MRKQYELFPEVSRKVANFMLIFAFLNITLFCSIEQTTTPTFFVLTNTFVFFETVLWFFIFWVQTNIHIVGENKQNPKAPKNKKATQQQVVTTTTKGFDCLLVWLQ